MNEFAGHSGDVCVAAVTNKRRSESGAYDRSFRGLGQRPVMGGIVEQDAQPRTDRRIATTACRVCAVGCGTLVELDGDRVVKVSGDPDDPWSLGYTCSFGRAAPAFHEHPDRLDRPLVRSGGALTPTSWDDALDDIATTVRDLVERHGPDSIAHYTGTGGPLDPSGYAMAHEFVTTHHIIAQSMSGIYPTLVRRAEPCTLRALGSFRGYREAR